LSALIVAEALMARLWESMTEKVFQRSETVCWTILRGDLQSAEVVLPP
jgi:hypothetical protein